MDHLVIPIHLVRRLNSRTPASQAPSPGQVHRQAKRLEQAGELVKLKELIELGQFAGLQKSHYYSRIFYRERPLNKNKCDG